MKHILALIALCLAVTTSAETWDIGKHLQVTPDSALDVTLQPLPDYDKTENLIHGWKGDDLHYVILVDQQPGGKKHSKYWRELLREMKLEADDKKLSVLSEGSLITESESEVTHKLITWMSEGDPLVQMISLIVGKKYAYWLISSPFSEDTDFMVEQTKSLLKTVNIN